MENENKTLIDPFMQEESPEALEAKKRKWEDIFNQYPEFADAIINVLDNKTEKSFIKFTDIVKNIASL